MEMGSWLNIKKFAPHNFLEENNATKSRDENRISIL